MSRRDTIIVAVLVNAALLMILFVTAMRSDHPTKKNKLIEGVTSGDLAINYALESPIPSDNILNEYIAGMPTIAELKPGSVMTFEETECILAAKPEEVIESLSKTPLSEEIKIPLKKGEEHFVNITVKKGDFLEKIAKANHTTVAAIMDMNRMSTTQLKIGQVLKVPLDGKKLLQKTSALPSSPSSNNQEYYVVKEGDSPWLIASRNKIKLEDLLRLNELDEQKAKRLRPGDKLRIR